MGSLSTELLEEILALSSQGLLVVDASESEVGVVYANPAYEELSGYSLTELQGSAWLDHVAADEGAPELVRLRQSLARDEPAELSLPFLRKDGDIRLARTSLCPLPAAGGNRRLWLVQHRAEERGGNGSATLLKRAFGRARCKLASIERTDPVTGLMARGPFELLLRRDLAMARREDRTLCLMLFSVPELDAYRQTFGDNAADSCLRMVGAQIAGTFRRASDLCARVDESTFAVAVPGQNEEQSAQLAALVSRKTRNLGLHNPRGRRGRYVFVSCVWAMAEPATDDVDDLMTRATAALEVNDEPPRAVAGSA